MTADLVACPTCDEPVADVAAHKEAEECLTLEACTCGKCKGCPDGYHHNPLDWPCICTPDCVLAADDD
jgi:hypothetical protein